MSTIIPRSELVQRAVRWISEERVAQPGRPLVEILDEAAIRFDLTPIESAWLRETLLPGSQPPPPV